MRSVLLTGADQQIVTTTAAVPCATYRGVTLKEFTGGATATVRIWDGTTGNRVRILDEITLLAGESVREDYGDPAPTATIGIFFQVVSGAVSGSVRLD